MAQAYLAPDPALPQRDLLLDSPSVTAHLSHLLGNGKPAAIDRCERLRAGLQYLRRGNRIAISANDTLAETFLAGYAAVRPLPGRAALGWHTAAALFIERAFHAVTRVRPNGLRHLGELLRDAGQLVTEACDV